MPVSTTGLGDIQNQLLRKHFLLTPIVFEPTKCWGETTERRGGGDSVVGYKSGSLVPNVFASRMSTIAPQDVP